MIIPPGPNPTIPVEPAEIPCSNPPECEEYDTQIARALKWDQWEYKCWSLDPSTPDKVLHIAGYEYKWYRAKNANMNLAHGDPYWEIATGNMIEIIRQPAPAT